MGLTYREIMKALKVTAATTAFSTTTNTVGTIIYHSTKYAKSAAITGSLGGGALIVTMLAGGAIVERFKRRSKANSKNPENPIVTASIAGMTVSTLSTLLGYGIKYALQHAQPLSLAQEVTANTFGSLVVIAFLALSYEIKQYYWPSKEVNAPIEYKSMA